MRTNTKTKATIKTHEGAPAKVINPVQQLRRVAMANLLWEDQFYIDGVESGKLIGDAVSAILTPASATAVAEVISVAVEAREQQHLRHLPLYLMALLAHQTSGDPQVKNGIARVIQRADELPEFLSIWAKVAGVDPKQLAKIPGQVKKGLALAFTKFDGYQLAKYDRDNAIKLLDVARLVHPQHTDAIGGLVKGTLEAPDTWEVSLSGGGDKKETFERLLMEGRLGYLALLRNLRNMVDANVDRDLVKTALLDGKGAQRVLPFRYIAASRHAPSFANEVQEALLRRVAAMREFPGRTLVLVDVSGSMTHEVSGKSEISRMDAAAALASIWPGEKRVFSFSTNVEEVECFPGLPGILSIIRSQWHGGTNLGSAVREMNDIKADRLVVITDEQSHDRVPDPAHKRAYMINVAGYRNGVGYGKWTHIDGWSENIFRFIEAVEEV